MAKPEFDPNKPFQPVQVDAPEKPEFDPNKPFEAVKTPTGPGAAQAFLEHFGDAGTLGYLPQLQAGTERLRHGIDLAAAKLGLGPDTPEMVDEKLKAQGFSINQPEDSYVSLRDANRKRMTQESEAHPYASKAGTIAGIGAGMVLAPGGATAKSASALERFVRAAKAGAAYGAAANPGDVEGEIDPLQLGDRTANAVKGAGIGLAAQGLVEAVPGAVKLAGWAKNKLGGAATGIPEETIQNYSARTAEVNQMYKDAGGELSVAADKVRQDVSNAIQGTKKQLNGQITKALETAPKDPVAPATPMIEVLEKAKAGLNPNLKSDAISDLDEMIAKLRTEAESQGSDGNVSLQSLYEIKKYLQEQASSAYVKGGQIFTRASEAAQAAKQAAGVARKILHPMAPEIANADNQLSVLHTLESNLNKNLIAPGKSDSALFAAGAGSNPRNAKLMDQIGDITGYPLTQKAQDLASARTFGKPQLLPVDATGKAVARQAGAALLGHTIGGPIGATVGAAATSPATLKLAINIADKLKQIPSGAAFAQNNPIAFQALVSQLVRPSTDLQQASSPILENPKVMQLMQENPGLIDDIQDPRLKAEVQKALGRNPARTPMGRRLSR